MLEETYLKEFDKENELCIISFEGDKEDIYELRDYAKMINSVKDEARSKYYRGFSKNISNNSDCEDNYGKADYETVVNPVVKTNIDEILNSMCIDSDVASVNSNVDDICKSDMIDRPSHYRSGEIETIKKIEAVVDGLPARESYLLGNIIKYIDRAGKKDDAYQDMSKANNYAHRLVYGEWRHEH